MATAPQIAPADLARLAQISDRLSHITEWLDGLCEEPGVLSDDERAEVQAAGDRLARTADRL